MGQLNLSVCQNLSVLWSSQMVLNGLNFKGSELARFVQKVNNTKHPMLKINIVS